MASMQQKTCLLIASAKDLMSMLLKLVKEGNEKLCHKLHMFYGRSKGRWCGQICKLKFPDGYSSNLSRCLEMRNASLHNLKGHDCQFFMQSLLPLAFRDLLFSNVWKVLTELSQFFRDLCCSKLHVDDIVCLENNIVEILCQLERVFPLVFFNVMKHLPIHLPREQKIGGPI